MKHKKKSKLTKILEYVVVYVTIRISRTLPQKVIQIMSTFLGNFFYFLVPRRRSIALKNLRSAFKGEKNEKEIRTIARHSCKSFILLSLETLKIRLLFTKPNALSSLRPKTKNLDKLFYEAKKIHDDSGGCIFVTPHIGNWEVLPYVSSVVGIPLTVVIRPLDNIYLENLLYAYRVASGQVIIPKRKALLLLQETLRKGKSIGILPDQSTLRGISVNFFGCRANTTPIPAMLSIWYKRPIVVVACCREPDNYHYEGFVCDPIWSGEYTSEKAEIFRLTEEMNRKMESIIRKYPEQYLWIHDRWRIYKSNRDLLL